MAFVLLERRRARRFAGTRPVEPNRILTMRRVKRPLAIREPSLGQIGVYEMEADEARP
jgi:hypothetical protein